MDTYPCEHSCLALVFLVMYYWITEAIPNYVTSYIIPLVSVLLRMAVNKQTGMRYDSVEISIIFASEFMHPVIFVFLGSITLSTALSKHEIKTLLSYLLL